MGYEVDITEVMLNSTKALGSMDVHEQEVHAVDEEEISINTRFVQVWQRAAKSGSRILTEAECSGNMSDRTSLGTGSLGDAKRYRSFRNIGICQRRD